MLTRSTEIIREFIEAREASGTATYGFWDRLVNSNDRMDVFFRPEFGDPRSVPIAERERFVQRIGHGAHLLEPIFSALVLDAEFYSVVGDILNEEPCPIQSMLIYKQPRGGMEFSWHQAESFFKTEPSSVVFAFIALEDADEDNGCLRALPGCLRGPVHVEFLVTPGQEEFTVRCVDERQPDFSKAVYLPMRQGSAAFFHGRTYHGSDTNRSDRSRRALVSHWCTQRSSWLDTNFMLDARPLFAALTADQNQQRSD